MFHSVPQIAQARPLSRIAGRICEVLDKRSKIEPDDERDASLSTTALAERNLKPADFKGHIEFKDVQFTYPSSAAVACEQRHKFIIFMP